MDAPAQPATGITGRIDGFFDRFVAGWNPYHPTKLGSSDLEPVNVEEAPVRRSGTRLVLLGAVLFFVWSITAPINYGSVVPGSVTVAGYRKSVQHPKGGVVSRVLVGEGSVVKAGQVLLQINPLEAEADVSSLQQEYINTLVTESRATAELLGKPIAWAPELAKFDPVRVAQAKSVQLRLYQTRQIQFQEQAKGLNAQVAGLSGAIAAHRIQLDTLSQELDNTQKLAKEGFVPQQQVNITLRTKVDQQAALETAQAETGKIRAQMAELRSQFQTEVAKELSEVQKNRDGIASKLRAAEFSQSLSEIRAPVAGTVVNLKVFTEGGVVGGGEVLMEIVPDTKSLIVEAKVPPGSIDAVQVGQEADLRFTAFNIATTPVVKGRVRAVGVDKLKAKPGEEVREGEDYYLAQVETTEDDLKVLEGKQLRAGMPVDVMINRGSRTFMSYVLKPLTDKLAKAFRD